MSSSQSQLSNALRITNVNDFLTPAANCVLPLGGGAAPAGSVLAPIIPTAANAEPFRDAQKENPRGATADAAENTPAVATVTVSDCLSCSGCVTSADTVLLSTASVDALRAYAAARPTNRTAHFAVAVLSQQSVASLAAANNLSLTATARRVTTFLRETLHFDAVLDGAFARHFALLESAREFLERRRAGKRLTIAAACPGWLTYAEKTQPPVVLDALSTVRSAQAVAGALAQQLRPPDSADRPVWLLSVAPCHDRKLEATRPEFDGQVACVITTTELRDLLAEHEVDLATAPESALTDHTKLYDNQCPAHLHKNGTTRNEEDNRHDPRFGVAVDSGSDGYAGFILRHAARELLGVELAASGTVFEKASRSGDIRVATVTGGPGKGNPSGETLRFATAYGFRSLQAVLRRLRGHGECAYDYIELMACPGGCNNGGGQIARVDDVTDTRAVKARDAEFLAGVERRFFDAPGVADPLEARGVREMYKAAFEGEPRSGAARERLSIRIESRQSTAVTPASLEW